MKNQGCASFNGTRGSGKTALANSLIEYRKVNRRLVVTPFAEEWEGDPVRSRSGFHGRCDALSDRVSREPFAVVYEPRDESESDAVARAAEWASTIRDCTLIVDEAHDSCSAHDCPRELLTFAKRGRHYNAALWCLAQRPVDLHAGLRAELHANEAWYLRLVEHTDLDSLRARRGQEFADRVARLKMLHALKLMPSMEEPVEYRLEFVKGRRTARLLERSQLSKL